MVLSLQFEYTQDEFVKANKQYLFASKIISKKFIAFIIIYLLVAVYFFFIPSYFIVSSLSLFVGVFASICFGVLYFYMPRYAFKTTKKYHEEYTLQFSEDNIKFITPTINSKLQWNIYSAAWESDDFYFLIQTPRIYTLIPKRALLNAADKQAFEEIIVKKLQGIQYIA